MSKRAEELAQGILGLSFVRCEDSNAVRLYGKELAALIDAELKAERERCAARFRDRLGQWSPMSPGMVTIKETLLTDGIAVILESEEE